MPLTTEEFDRQYRLATKRGEQRLRKLPLAKAISYDRDRKQVVLELNNGCSLLIPVQVLQGLQSASEKELEDVVVWAPGISVEWPQLDLQYSVEGLLAGRFGTKRWMEQLGKRRRGGAPARPTRARRKTA